MGFRIHAPLYDHEYRGMQTRPKEDGNGQWMTIIFETPDEEANRLEVTVPEKLQRRVMSYNLVRGGRYNVEVLAAAGIKRGGGAYSFLEFEGFFEDEENDALPTSTGI